MPIGEKWAKDRVHREDMWLCNLDGTLCHLNEELVYFKIENMELVDFKQYTDHYLPHDLWRYGINYKSINSFFRERVVLDGSQDIREYLDAMGMTTYDFETLVKKTNGFNGIDYYWLKFSDGTGLRKYEEFWEYLDSHNK